MQVDVIDTFEDLEGLRTDWEAAYSADPGAHFFLSWTWIFNWLRRLSYPWVVLAVRSGPGSHVAFLPLQIRAELDERTGFYNSLRMAGSYFAVYTGLLCRPEHEGNAVAALAGQVRQMNWRSLQLEDFHVSPERRHLFLRHFHGTQFVEQKIVRGPHVTESGEDIDHDLFVHVELPSDWEHYLTVRLGRLARRNARHYLRLIDENSEYGVTISDSHTVGQDLETLFRFWLGRWEDRNPSYARGLIGNCRAMLPGLFRDGRLLVLVLRKDGVPVGVHLNFVDRDKGTIHCFLAGRDPAVTKLPPGFALHMFTMRWAIANGFVSYDLGTGNYGYKAAFGSQTRLIEGISISTLSARNLGERLDRRTLGPVFSWAKRLHHEGESKLAAIGCSQIQEVDDAFEEAGELLRLIEAETARSLAQAVELHRSGCVGQAAQIYASVLAQAPRHIRANYMMGVACLQKREFAAAEIYLKRAIEADPRHPAAHNNLGNVMRATGRHEDAERCYEIAIGLSPEFAEAYNNLGVALQSLGRLGEAEAQFKKALSLKPEFDSAIRNYEQVSKARNDAGSPPVAFAFLGALLDPSLAWVPEIFLAAI
ncbi:MAG: hypothetical protein ABS35_20130 [Kaistia sp. SCN 65-12]|nr:MAG: hypothetical protein ABS35_20130 [Kaistia sp. SCN 65-12]